MTLPSPHQTWAHSTCCVASLTRALEDDSVTAIEADVVMGTCVAPGSPADDADGAIPSIPIMAHPPDRTSDLSLRSFLERSWRAGKHLKLDVKEEDAVLPVLDELRRMPRTTADDADGPFVWLNADVLPGPGQRHRPMSIGADAFVGPCLEHMAEEGRGSRAALSLGWRTDPRSMSGYAEDDARAMERLLRDHGLEDGNFVLAVCARVLSKDRGALDGLMAAFPKWQMLVWTGTGEPPISAGLQRRIRDHFDAAGCGERVGFDCNVAPNAVAGWMYDAAVAVVGIGWTVKNMFFDPHQ